MTHCTALCCTVVPFTRRAWLSLHFCGGVNSQPPSCWVSAFPLWQLEEQKDKAEQAKEDLGRSLRGTKAVDEDEAAFLDQLISQKRKKERMRQKQVEDGLDEWEAEQQRLKKERAKEQV